MSSLTRYDLPAPERARTTLLWLSWAHRSHQTTPASAVFSPYSTPAGRRAVAGQGRGQVGGGERERGGEGVGVEDPPHPQPVDGPAAGWWSSPAAAARSPAACPAARTRRRPDLRDRVGQFVLRWGRGR